MDVLGRTQSVASAKEDSGAFRLSSQLERGERDVRVQALSLDMNVLNMLVYAKIKTHRETLLQLLKMLC